MKRKRNTSPVKKTAEEKLSKHEDIAQKIMAEYFREEIMPALKIEGKAVASLATEEVGADLHKGYQDFNFLMEDDSIKHFEFQSTNEGLIGLKRFRMYESVISYRQRREVTTYVMFSGKIKRPMTEFKEGINTYKVVPIILSDKDADQVIGELKRKVEAEESLTKADLLPLCLSPLMGGKMPQKDRIMAAYDITRKAMGVTQDVIQKVEAVIYIMADKFLDAKEMKQLKEELKMTKLGQMLYEDGRSEGRREHLIMQVKKKLAKGKVLEVIAEELEADIEMVRAVVKELCG